MPKGENDNLIRVRLPDVGQYDKIRAIARREERPIGWQVGIVFREYIAAYEAAHGEIEIGKGGDHAALASDED